MKFLCLAYEREQTFHQMPRAEWDALREETLAYVEVLRKSGHLISTEPLKSARTAATVRVRDGAAHVLDGPYAETKEQLLGLYLLDCSDLDEALGVARDLARANPGGAYEIRPIRLYRPGASIA
jgi:hypothetical protein